MRVVAVALSQLDDAATCARVLQWAAARFCPTNPVASVVAFPAPAAAAAVTLQPRPPAAPVPDDGLSVSMLGEWFDELEPQGESSQSSQSLNGMLHQFVAEFQDVVHEWNAVCSDVDTKAQFK